MTTKQYLSQIRQLDMIIRHKEEELEKMRNPVGIRGIDYSADRVQRSPSNNGMAAVEQMVDRQRKAQSELNSLIRKRDRIISQIQSMDNAVFSQVLYMRYVEGERLEDIARELGYVYSYARKLHGWALQDFERRNKKEQKGTKENMTNKKNVL